MTHTVRSKWRFLSDRSNLRGLTLVAMVGTLMVGPSGLPVSGQGHSKPVIQLVATGGTIANTRGGRIPIQQTIADIRKNFPETVRLLERVEFEVTDLLRIGSQDFMSHDFLSIARTVNEVIDKPRRKGCHCDPGPLHFGGHGLLFAPAGQEQQTGRYSQLSTSSWHGGKRWGQESCRRRLGGALA